MYYRLQKINKNSNVCVNKIHVYYVRLHLSSSEDRSEITNVPSLHLAVVPMDALSINHDQNGKMLQSQFSGLDVKYLKSYCMVFTC